MEFSQNFEYGVKTIIDKNLAIVMRASRQFLTSYLLKSPSNGEGHHLVGSSLDVVMNKFNILTFPNYCNFVSGFKHFVYGENGHSSTMMLKDHSSFKYVYGSRFMGQSKDKICVFKMSIDIPRSLGVVWILLNVCKLEKI
jgi:hypothetical protein